MFELFKKESKYKDGITKIKTPATYCLIVAAVMLIGSVVQSILVLPLVIGDLDSVEAIDTVLASQTMTLYNLYLTIVISLMILYVGIKMHGRSFESMGLSAHHALKHYLIGLAVGFLTLSGAMLITYVFGGARFAGIDLSNIGLLLLYFVGFLFQGFEEELLCRGFMMFGLSKNHSVFFSMMFNSLLFAALHIGNPGVSPLALANLFLAGLSFSCMAVYFDNIWAASGAHSMWNFAQGNFYGILVSGMSMGPSVFKFELVGNALISGGSFGLEGGIGVFLVEIITILIFCLLYKYKKEKVM
ncbi:CPBP family intramembrane glutamic endopeptidase [Traorella massiliensis]|uniref:CPBP family intramembrane glutamic endopeptidase n=1 Tax=Traorella massiliensis TaxID=1903263 RepID=UPI0008F8C09C|nr:CPBP family intramembrane glutamic endopeptidase [Traorella massiliensis]